MIKNNLDTYQLDLFPPVLAVRKVGANSHITFDGVNYSVNHVFIKSLVIVRASSTFIDILDSYGHCVASHKRSYSKRGYITDPSHMPPYYYSTLHRNCYDGAMFRRWAKSIGDNIFQLIDTLLTNKVVEEQGYKSCMAILQLSKKFGNGRLNDACGHALSEGKISYYSIHKFLTE